MVSQTEAFFAIQTSLPKISISSRNCKSSQKEANNKEINPSENLLKTEIHYRENRLDIVRVPS